MSEAPRQLLTLRQCALALGIEYGTLRHDRYRRGLTPVVPGSRGRGHSALYDLEQVRALRAAQQTGKRADVRNLSADPLERVTRRASRLWEVIDACAWSIYMQAGPGKERIAGALAAMGYLLIENVDDEFRDLIPDLPRPPVLPPNISRLRSISGTFRQI